jgi:hypothetical protein
MSSVNGLMLKSLSALEMPPCHCRALAPSCVCFDRDHKGCSLFQRDGECNHKPVKWCKHAQRVMTAFFAFPWAVKRIRDGEELTQAWLERLAAADKEEYAERPVPPLQLVTSREERLALMCWRAAHNLSVFGPEAEPLRVGNGGNSTSGNHVKKMGQVRTA